MLFLYFCYVCYFVIISVRYQLSLILCYFCVFVMFVILSLSQWGINYLLFFVILVFLLCLLFCHDLSDVHAIQNLGLMQALPYYYHCHHHHNNHQHHHHKNTQDLGLGDVCLPPNHPEAVRTPDLCDRFKKFEFSRLGLFFLLLVPAHFTRFSCFVGVCLHS